MRHGVDGWWAASYVVLWLVVLALCVVVVALARQIGTLHLRLGPRGALEMDDEGPPLGEVLPPVEVTAADGRPAVIGGPGEDRLLLFVSPGCRTCEDVLPALPAIARAHDLDPYVVTDLDAAETASAYRDHRLGAPLIAGVAAVRPYDIPGTPYLLVVGDDGIVRAKGTVNNLEQMEGLVATARRRLEQPTVGTEAH
ncbi:MAG: methylamine dehydrogenase accessory protein MauD [Actinomycetota bacterium]